VILGGWAFLMSEVPLSTARIYFTQERMERRGVGGVRTASLGDPKP